MCITRRQRLRHERHRRHASPLGLFDAGHWIEVEHDDATHQLRVIGAASSDEVRARRSGHYRGDHESQEVGSRR